jgi:hypothetical protein
VNQSRQEASKIDDSKVRGGKKKKKAAKSTENFIEELLNAINRVRANPAEFAKNITDSIGNIKQEEGKIIFDAHGTKVALVNGESAFLSAGQKLLTLESAAPLELSQDLVIQVPEDHKDWKNNGLITQLLAKKKAENGSKYPECAFNMDLGISDPETSLLLQIVDDSPFKGKRRDNILNPLHRHVGISFMKLKSKFCCYITFAK